jgi:hypothetical protein
MCKHGIKKSSKKIEQGCGGEEGENDAILREEDVDETFNAREETIKYV